MILNLFTFNQYWDEVCLLDHTLWMTTPEHSIPKGRRLTLTDMGVADVAGGLLVVEGLTLLTVTTHRVVATVVTHPAAHPPRQLEDGRVKVTPVGVVVTFTH